MQQQIFRFGAFQLDESLLELRRGGAVIEIQPKPFFLILYLLRHRDRVVSREELMRELWPDVAVSDLPDLNVRGQQYIGRSLVVEQAIQNGRGKVRVGDSMWAAEGPDAPAGSRVTVTGTRGTVLVVERATA